MKITYKIRVLFDQEQETFRDFEIIEGQSFEILHHAIKEAFNIESEEMASFYVSNDEWDKGEEIPLIDMQILETEEQVVEMHKAIVSDYLMLEDQKFIYVYDFLKMWCFYVELIGEGREEKGKGYPNVFLSVGDSPKFDSDREDLTFEGEKQGGNSYEDILGDFDDEFSQPGFESLDDLGDEYL